MTSRAAICTALLVLPLVAVVPPTAGADEPRFDTTVTSFDGHEVPITVYRALNTSFAPTLLWGHGWAGSRADAVGSGEYFAKWGYNVVAMDMRGHGAARGTSEARVHDVDVEVKDVIAVIDWIALQEWAQLDASGDPTLGALGGSYGGGYQLLTAAFDDRLDAIAPEITWNDLPRSLAPNGGIKSGWVDLLYWGGNARANLAPFIHQAYAYAMSTNEFPAGQAPGVPDVVSQFTRSSPKSYEIDTPAFLIQGTPDTLFNLNEAMDNARQIAATGAEVKLMTHLGGHIISTNGIVPVPLPDTGLQPGSGPSPCGNVRAKVLEWYNTTLKGAPDTLPRVAIGMDDGRCVEAATLDYYALDARALEVSVPLTTGAPVATADARLLGQPVRASVATLSLGAATQATDVAGIPRVSGQVEVLGSEAIVYFALARQTASGATQVLSSQVTPLRLTGPGTHAFDIELGGVAAALAPGETLLLQLSTADGQFAHNFERAPGAVIVTPRVVHVPVFM